MEWLKKILCNVWFYIILIIASLIAPFVINELYKFGQEHNVWYYTLWEAKDVFAFLGDYLSFFGTIVLGAVAVFQTDRANKLAENANNQTDTANKLAEKATNQTDTANSLARDALKQAERANELSLQMHRLEQSKFFSIVSINNLEIHERSEDSLHYHDKNFPNPKIFNLVNTERSEILNCYHIDFIIKNESEFPIDSIRVNCKGRFEAVNYRLKETTETVYIAPYSMYVIRVVIPADYLKKDKAYNITIDIFYQNIFGYETHAQLVIDDISKEYNHKYTYQFQRIFDIPFLENEIKD